jgi:hypothetical protein
VEGAIRMGATARPALWGVCEWHSYRVSHGSAYRLGLGLYSIENHTDALCYGSIPQALAQYRTSECFDEPCEWLITLEADDDVFLLGP